MFRSAFFLALFLVLGLLPLYGQVQRYTISGFVTDSEDGEKLIGANLFVYKSQAGTVTNNYGFYSLTLPADSVYLRVSYLGYRTRTLAIDLRRNLELNIELTPAAVGLDEVVVSAERAEEALESTRMGVVELSIEQVKTLPALLGEVDIIKAIQLLPGVQSGSEGSSGLYVRGGGPDQNLVLLDGAPVYNVSHIFGFFSVFNADALQNVELVKGGFPARYGGRLSSVLDISMKEGNLKEFTAEGALGLISSKLTLQGPLMRDKMSFIVSGRRTYIDILARPFLKGDGVEDPIFYFYDLNAKVNYIPSRRSRLYLSVYAGRDAFGSTSDQTYTSGSTRQRELYRGAFDWGNVTSTLRWNYLFSNKLFSNTTLTFSRYAFDVLTRITTRTTPQSGPTLEAFEEVRYRSGIEDWSAKVDFDYRPAPDHYIRFGASATRHYFNPGVGAFTYKEVEGGPVEFSLTPNTFAFSGLEYFVYAEDDVRLSAVVKANLGLHFSGMQVKGITYTALQPRLALRYLLADGWALKASFGTMQQYLHLLTNTGINLPTDLWLAATDRIEPQRAWQAAGGVTHTFGGYEASLEGYYKKMRNLIEYREGANFINANADWQDKVEVGAGWSYGAEVFVQKKEGRTTGWVGYTLSWSERRFDNLNGGLTFPYRYDRRHDVSVVVAHRLLDNLDLGATWVYGTGNAVTLATARFYDQDPFSFYFSPELFSYGERNSFRMGAYHRFDVSLNWHRQRAWFSKNGESTLSLSVYNAYNRKNPFYIYASRGDFGENLYKQASLFPILPSISYSFRY